MADFKQLPVLHNAQGELRKVGFELEYAKVGVEESVQIIRSLYGGEVQADQRFCQRVTGTRLGDFTVEIDLRFLTDKTYNQLFEKMGINLQDIKLGESSLEERLENALESVICKFIPYEVATPPVPFTEIHEFEKLRNALYEHHAEGTEAYPTNAFGTHINVEIPDSDTNTILRYLRAFILLYPWLLEAGETDFTRLRMTSYINPYPAAYATLILHPAYHPDMEMMLSDYHKHNPDRNRPLDLYPLLAALLPEKIKQYENLGKVKPRQSFHYRLPNSWVSRPDWSLAREWNNWVVIEELANDPERLMDMRKAYLALQDDTMIGFDNKWAKQTIQWLS